MHSNLGSVLLNLHTVISPASDRRLRQKIFVLIWILDCTNQYIFFYWFIV